MGIYLNPGNQGFCRMLRSKIYIDKTGLLHYTNEMLDTEQCQLCISRPRRFGKSVTAQMLTAYYGRGCHSKELFQNYAAAAMPDFETHLNRYDVIHADMNEFLNRIDEKTGHPLPAICTAALFQSEIIRELEQEFPSLAVFHETSLPMALTRIYEASGTMFIIIIDEWDAIFRENKEDIQAQKAYLELLRGLFKNANSRKFLKLAYLTGILPIKKYGTESALNNFKEFTMLHPGKLAQYIGFTEEEVYRLCQEYQMDFEEAKKWYDGYTFKKGFHVYNPNSIVNAMLDEEYTSYWSQTETYESLKYYISMDFDGLKESVVRLLAGERYKVDTGLFDNDLSDFKGRDDILTALIHLGYLAYDAQTQEVYIPNKEVRMSFAGAVKKGKWEQVTCALEASEKLLQATWRMDSKTVAKGIEEVHMSHASILNYHDENALSCVISLAYYSAVDEYMLIRELPAGKGFADMVFLPRNGSDKPAMIVELKYNRSVKSALNQIKERQYTKVLDGYAGRILLVGITYDKKTKVHTCRIEEWDH